MHCLSFGAGWIKSVAVKLWEKKAPPGLYMWWPALFWAPCSIYCAWSLGIFTMPCLKFYSCFSELIFQAAFCQLIPDTHQVDSELSCCCEFCPYNAESLWCSGFSSSLQTEVREEERQQKNVSQTSFHLVTRRWGDLLSPLIFLTVVTAAKSPYKVNEVMHQVSTIIN